MINGVQTIFCSDLVNLSGSVSNDRESNHFVIATQFWIYPAFTFSLMAITVIPAMLWERWQRRLNAHSSSSSIGR